MRDSKLFREEKLWLPLVSFIVIFLYLTKYQASLLAFKESLKIFMFDKYYFMGFLDEPGGLLEYFSNFLAQFSYIPWLGALVLLGLLLLIYWQTLNLIHFSRTFYFVSFVPMFFVLASQSYLNYSLSIPLGILLVLVFVNILSKIRNIHLKYFAAITFTTLLFFAIGGYFYLFVILALIKEMGNNNKRLNYYYALFLLVLSIALPLFSYKYIYPTVQFRNIFSAQLPTYESFTSINILLLFVLLFLFYPMTLVLSKLKTNTKGIKQKWLALINLFGTVSLASIIMLSFSSVNKDAMLFEANRAFQNRDYQKVLRISKSNEKSSVIMTYLTNVSLCKLGSLSDKMFRYDQSFGPTGLILPFSRGQFNAYFGGELYYTLGFNNLAYRWAFETQVLKGQSGPLLQRLAITSIINGDYQIAQRYLNSLSKTIFYSEWAKKYQPYLSNEELVKSDSEIMQKRALLLEEKDFLHSDKFDSKTLFLNYLMRNQKNIGVFDCYMAYILLSKDLDLFYNTMPNTRLFYKNGLPIHFEEALLMHQALNMKGKQLEYPISQETRKRFDDFNKVYSGYKNKSQAKKMLKKSHGKTYWYYVLFFTNKKEGKAKTGGY